MIYLLIGALLLTVIMIVGLVFLYLDMRNEYHEMRKLNDHYLDIYTGYRGVIEKELSIIREIQEKTTIILDKCIKITSDNHEDTKVLVNTLAEHMDAINDCYTKLEDRYSQLYDQYKDLKLEMKSRTHDILAAMPDNFNVPDEETLEERLNSQ